MIHTALLTQARTQGPQVYYVDSDGTRLKGDLFSVGSGSTFAYGILDQGYHWDLSDEDAQELGRRSIYAAGHRDAFSGNTINLYHIKEDGWRFIGTVSLMSRYQDLLVLIRDCRKLRCLRYALRWSWGYPWSSWSWLRLRYPDCGQIVC